MKLFLTETVTNKNLNITTLTTKTLILDFT